MKASANRALKGTEPQDQKAKFRRVSTETQGGPLASGTSEEQVQRILRRYVPGNHKWSRDDKVVAYGLGEGKVVDEKVTDNAVPLDQAAVRESFGTDSRHAVLRLMRCLSEGVNAGKKRQHLERGAAIGVLRAMGPQNVIEGMFMAQMLMMHEQAARLMRASYQSDLPIDLILRCVNAANSCMKTFQEGMEALNRFRAGGKQQVIVSHVNIEPGAQAAFAVGGDVKGGGGEPGAQR